MSGKRLRSVVQMACLVIASFLMAGCDWINPDEEIPAYIHISSIAVDTDVNTYGTNAHGMTDVWVFVDDNLTGVYELPTTFPILKAGASKVEIFGGIKRNGISTNRIIYPFYSTYVTNLELTPGKVDTINPVLDYRDNVQVALIENFEDAGLAFEPTPQSGVDTLDRTNNPQDIFEPSWSGFFTIPEGAIRAEFATIDELVLPRFGIKSMVEMHFRTNIPITVGFFADNGFQIDQIPVVTVFPTDEWKKIYIDLTDDVIVEPVTTKFKLFLRASNTTAIVPEIYVDNIKLLHF